MPIFNHIMNSNHFFWNCNQKWLILNADETRYIDVQFQWDLTQFKSLPKYNIPSIKQVIPLKLLGFHMDSSLNLK